mgnify:CR=1 FL=1
MLGHNMPPLAETLPIDHQSLIDEARDLLAAFERAPKEINDGDTAAKMTDFIKRMNRFVTRVDGTRKEVKQPFLDGGREVDAFFNGISDRLSPPIKSAKQVLGAYNAELQRQERERAERERLAREAEAEAARKEAEAAMNDPGIDTAEAQEEMARAEAMKKEAEKVREETVRTKGAIAGSSTKIVLTVQSIDPTKVDLEALRPFLKEADLIKAANAYIRAGHAELNGAVIVEEHKTVVR